MMLFFLFSLLGLFFFWGGFWGTLLCFFFFLFFFLGGLLQILLILYVAGWGRDNFRGSAFRQIICCYFCRVLLSKSANPGLFKYLFYEKKH